MSIVPVERYGLYGEPIRHVEPRFLHVEPIRLRSGQFAWKIDPHRHDDLHQILLVTQGGGTMQAEGSTFEIRVPALLVVPAGVVHAFGFLNGTDGWVVSIAQTALTAEVRNDGAMIALLEQASCTSAVAAEPAEVVAGCDRMLGVSRDRLLHACRRRFGRPPIEIVHQRVLLEAQRGLIYTARTIEQIGSALGFEDPAYFSRFFKKHTGIGPQRYRRSRSS